MSSAIFPWFRKYPKLYVRGCPRAIFLSRSNGNLCRWVQTHPVTALPDLTGFVMQNDPTLARRGLASALEQAWLSALANRAQVPVASILGGPIRNKVPFYANINRGISDRSAEGFAKRARTILDETKASGIKIAPFDGLRAGLSTMKEAEALIESGIERIAAVRRAIGPDPLLMIDCHSRFCYMQALELLREVSEYSIFWLEDPCEIVKLSATQQHNLRSTANALGIRIAGGEAALNLNEMTSLLADEGLDVVLPDLRYTGISQGIAMLHLANSRGIELSLHKPVGPVVNAFATHGASALPAFLILERQLSETAYYDEIVDQPVSTKDGEILAPTRAGLGFELNKEILKPVTASSEVLRLTRTYSGIPGAGPDA